MELAHAQREMRDVYLNAAPGQAFAAAMWFGSACWATWGSMRGGVLVLAVGGAFIFPLTQLSLLALGRRTTVGVDNPLRALAPQVAFIVPLTMPLAGVAFLYRAAWFYPAFMVIVGAHYLPFAFLYGRRAFLGLGAVIVGAGFVVAFTPNAPIVAGAWITAATLIGFAVMSIRPFS